MNDFIKILTHGRRLQGATKELSLDELQKVSESLENIISKRKEKEEALAKENAAKEAKKAEILKQMQDAGISLQELTAKDATPKAQNKRKGQKRPVKYKLKDKAGNEHPWTGIGRMPKVYAEALAKGKKLSDFSI